MKDEVRKAYAKLVNEYIGKGYTTFVNSVGCDDDINTFEKVWFSNGEQTIAVEAMMLDYDGNHYSVSALLCTKQGEGIMERYEFDY